MRHIFRFGSLLILSHASLNCPVAVFGADLAPYQGKAVLVIDQSITNALASQIATLTDDLIGDGWRVIRHDVARGLTPDDPNWASNDAPFVRQVQALIRADYDSAPAEVKTVFLLGRIPVPYSGTSASIAGGHEEYTGAHPADSFYGKMSSQFGGGGWSDYLVTPNSHAVPQFSNSPNDGKFDQGEVPSALELGVGRVDLSRMLTTVNASEKDLLIQYLKRDHDFRQRLFTVNRRAIFSTGPQAPDPRVGPTFGSVFSDVLITDPQLMTWFPNVSLDHSEYEGRDYLVGFHGGSGAGPIACYHLGATCPCPGSQDAYVNANSNNFWTYDSSVAFVTFEGSYFGSWDQSDDLLRAPLANPYERDPITGMVLKHGYGLGAVWGWPFVTDPASLEQRALGVCIGEALFAGKTQIDGNGGEDGQVVNANLMGDPTLRLYIVAPPKNLLASLGPNSVTLTWSAADDTSIVDYNVYRAPTRNGPYLLAGTTTATQLTAVRPLGSGAPDNFYMVRTAKAEAVPVTILPIGFYINLSEGAIVATPGLPLHYLQMLSQPTPQRVLVGAVEDAHPHAAAFAVDVAGVDPQRGDSISYQWYKVGSGQPLIDDSVHVEGATSRTLLLKDVQPGDVGSYYVVVSLGSDVQSSISASLLVGNACPTAANTTAAAVENQAIDIDVLANCHSSNPGATLSLKSVGMGGLLYWDGHSYPGLSTNGTLSIVQTVDGQRLRFTPNPSFFTKDAPLPETVYYVFSDGFGDSIGRVDITVVRDLLADPDLSRYGLQTRSPASYHLWPPPHAPKRPVGFSRDLANGDWELDYWSEIFGAVDVRAGCFASRQVSGDFELVANLSDCVSSVTDSHQNGIAGLMVRQHVNPPGNDYDNDGMYDMLVVVGLGERVNGQSVFAYAAQTDVPANVSVPPTVTKVPGAVTFPNAWVKMKRVGNSITVFGSSDGSSWNQLQAFSLANLGATADVGYYLTGGILGGNPSFYHATIRPLKLRAVSGSASQVSFEAFGPGGIPVTVQSSTDLTQWNDLTSVTTDLTTGTATVGPITTSGTQMFFRAFRANSPSFRSANAIGCVPTHFPAGVWLISNPLNAPNNSIGAVLYSPAPGAIFSRWNGSAWDSTTYQANGQWDHPEWTVMPGGGGFITLNSPWDTTFVGEVMQGDLALAIPGGRSVWSSMVPQAGPVSMLGLQASGGDKLNRWDGTQYLVYNWALGSWHQSEPSLGIGEAVVLDKNSPSNWHRTFWIWN